MPDGYSEEGLLELFIGQPDCIILVILLVFGEMPEDLCQLVSMNYQGVELKNETKVLPSFKNNLVIIFFESDGSVAGFKQEVKYSSDRWLKL